MFEVYNWKTGQCLQVRAFVLPALKARLTSLQLRGIDCPSYSTFTFLAPDIIALPNCTDNAIELCRIGAEPGTSGQPLELQTSCVLQLPRLGSGHSIAQVTCRSEPKVTNVTRYARAFHTRDPFHLNPENAIVIFNVMTHDAHGFHECLTLIVHTASLLSVLASKESPIPEAPAPGQPFVFGQSGLPPSDRPRSVPWILWGPRCCRWLETSFGASRWITTTCGQRYVTVEDDPIEDDARSSTIVVYDFNPHTVRRLAAAHRKKRRRLRGYWDVTLPEGELAVGSGEGVATFTRLEGGVLIPFTDPKTRVIGQIQCEPTELMAGYAMEYRIFDEAVMTRLPYAQLSSFETFGYGAVLLDRNMIIGVKVRYQRLLGCGLESLSMNVRCVVERFRRYQGVGDTFHWGGRWGIGTASHVEDEAGKGTAYWKGCSSCSIITDLLLLAIAIAFLWWPTCFLLGKFDFLVATRVHWRC